MTTDEIGHALLSIARNAIGERFGQAAASVSVTAELAAPGASFVTLTQGGKLRGCIGSLQPYRPLAADVAGNAVTAAFHDSRFPPLSAKELAHTRVEVSLLTPAEPMAFVDEADALARLRPGVDGVILICGERRSTFLPQVWESLPEARQFMTQLKLKAGLPADYWDGKISLARYGVQKWKEN
ncbi:MAG: AmmeMemoRadiSam system protein A [Rhodocyclaceae bacterium]